METLPQTPPHPRTLRKGRGATSNPPSRYDSQVPVESDDGWGFLDEDLPPLRTTVEDDASRSIIARNRSPDLPFDRSINPYRGCEHGCVYCFARPTHAYLGLSPGQDFETRLFAKPDAARLLEAELRKPGYQCRFMALGTNTDPYQPIERQRRITRGVLQVLADYNHPVGIVTKAHLVTRDIDILAPMAAKGLARVYVSVTTLDRGLARTLEPRAATPVRRLDAIRALSAAGIPTGVSIAPLIPAINDAEIENILAAAAQAGASAAMGLLLRLPLEVAPLFREWLAVHAPLKANHVMNLLRDMRGGKDYDAQWNKRMTGSGPYAELITRRFDLAAERLGLNIRDWTLDRAQFAVPPRTGDQLSFL
jgi:DNA repair photolyase